MQGWTCGFGSKICLTMKEKNTTLEYFSPAKGKVVFVARVPQKHTLQSLV